MVDEMWFDYKGKPLKWHYPLGVLFDLFGTTMELPWSLTVHFQGFPHDQLLRCSTEEVVKTHFTNVLKESNYVKHGDCSKVYGLSVSETNDIWEGLKNNHYSQFWSANSKLFDDIQSLKHVPVRLFLRDSQKDQHTMIQEPIVPLDEKKEIRTLGSVLTEILPNVFNEQQKNVKVLIQGTNPSLSTPITWLLYNLSYPDNFLYIVVQT